MHELGSCFGEASLDLALDAPEHSGHASHAEGRDEVIEPQRARKIVSNVEHLCCREPGQSLHKNRSEPASGGCLSGGGCKDADDVGGVHLYEDVHGGLAFLHALEKLRVFGVTWRQLRKLVRELEQKRQSILRGQLVEVGRYFVKNRRRIASQLSRPFRWAP